MAPESYLAVIGEQKLRPGSWVGAITWHVVSTGSLGGIVFADVGLRLPVDGVYISGVVSLSYESQASVVASCDIHSCVTCVHI